MTRADAGAGRLLGRAAEQAVIGGLLDAVDDAGGALVIRGAPGVGKSALLDWAGDTADDRLVVLRAAGTAAEFGLPYAAVHQVVRPVLAMAPRLSPHRQDALEVAFGRPAAAPPNLFSVAVATLDLLAEAAADRPLLVLADDAQWMDPASQLVLAFVARRIGSDRIVLLVTHRVGESGPLLDPTLPGLDLQPVDAEAAAQILDVVAGRLDRPVRDLVLDLARGNPLALRELPRTITTTRSEEQVRVPLTQRLESSFAVRIDTAGQVARTALEVAALSDSGELSEIVAATALLVGGPPVGVLDGMVATGLVEVDDRRLRFDHPLIRSCLYQRMGPDARRSVHRALADVLRDRPERSVWHRAAAALGPDPPLADDLERAADQAIARGAPINAVAALERSARLSQAGRRRERLFRAAMLAYSSGRADLGGRLRAEFQALMCTEHDQLRHEWLVELATGDHGGDSRVAVLVDAADRGRAVGDDALVLQFLRAAALRRLNFSADQSVGDTVVDAAERLVPVGDHASLAGLLAFGAPLQRVDEVLALVSSVETMERDATTTFELAHAAACVGAFDVSERLFGEAVAALRVEGRLHTLGTALTLLSWSALRRGRWAIAVSAAEEGARLCAETDQPFWTAYAHAGQAAAMALRGEFAAADALIGRAETIASQGKFAAASAAILVACSALAAGQGRHEDAFTQLARLHAPRDSARHELHGLWSLAALAESAVQCGQTDSAREVLTRLPREARTTRSPAVRMNVVYADAVLAPDDAIEERLEAALRADVFAWPFERSRLQLVYGSLLRRRQRVRASRQYLHAARDGFDQLGAKPWAERAREELRAAGERSRPARADAWDLLSPQEMQIATMVAQGLSNREIGERLFLSHRTVGSHLYRMFPKLGISSRVELVQMAAARDGGHR